MLLTKPPVYKLNLYTVALSAEAAARAELDTARCDAQALQTLIDAEAALAQQVPVARELKASCTSSVRPHTLVVQGLMH